MYKYFRHNEIDFHLWDRCIYTSEGGTIYALSWFLEIAAARCWDAYIKVENDEYVSVFPLPIKRRWGYKVLYNPVFCHQLGLFSINGPAEEDFWHILNLLKCDFKYINAYQINALNSTAFWKKTIDLPSTKITSYRISLDKSYHHIFDSFTKDRQRNILLSRSKDLEIRESVDLEELLNLFKENVAHKIYGGVKDYQYEMLRKINTSSSNFHHSKLFYVLDPTGKIIYGCLLLIYKNFITKFLNAGNQEARKLNCDSYFMDFILKKYSSSKFIFDFERESSVGVNDYTEGFNPDKISYLSVSYNSPPYLIQKIHEVRKLFVRYLKEL